MGTSMDFQLKGQRLALDRPLLMGIINVTPDSFSDGGQFYDPQRAVEHAIRLVGEGADLLDIGAESTRPGAQPVDEQEERRRYGAQAQHSTAMHDVLSNRFASVVPTDLLRLYQSPLAFC